MNLDEAFNKEIKHRAFKLTLLKWGLLALVVSAALTFTYALVSGYRAEVRECEERDGELVRGICLPTRPIR